jgi:hypothetical protein
MGICPGLIGLNRLEIAGGGREVTQNGTVEALLHIHYTTPGNPLFPPFARADACRVHGMQADCLANALSSWIYGVESAERLL